MTGIYIHIPFCVQKCRYCDFVSVGGRKELMQPYTDALVRQIQKSPPLYADTVFLGGGTPTALDDDCLERILYALNERFDITPQAEVTVEANPGTLSRDKIAVLRRYGVNRISLGAQSMNDNELRAIGRIHTAEDVRTGVKLLRESGFKNINIDLMTALPGQTEESLSHTIDEVIKLKPEHISCYSLIIEEGTPIYEDFRSGRFKELDEDTDRAFYRLVCSRLAQNGYKRYEISNFARPGQECRHNIKYWQGEDYLGLGAAAHSYIDGVRYHMTDDIEEYISGDFDRVDEEHLTREDRMGEFMILGLRMDRGVSKEEFKKRFGEDIEERFRLERFIKGGFMKYSEGRYSFTDKGIDVSNAILCNFV